MQAYHCLNVQYVHSFKTPKGGNSSKCFKRQQSITWKILRKRSCSTTRGVSTVPSVIISGRATLPDSIPSIRHLGSMECKVEPSRSKKHKRETHSTRINISELTAAVCYTNHPTLNVNTNKRDLKDTKRRCYDP